MDPDLPLIQAIQGGDDSALNELINRYREPLFHFAFRLVREESAANDVVQETFVRVYFGAPKFKPRATVKTWMYAIAVNLSRDHVRRGVRRGTEIPLDVQPAPAAVRDLADTGPAAVESAGQRDEFALLQRGIDALPDALREALVLFSLEGKSQREAADILGTSPKTVELRVYRAKNQLRRWFTAFRQHSSADSVRDEPPFSRLTKRPPSRP